MHDLTEESFDAAVTDNGLWFVKFYAPWCGHCQEMAPVMDAAAKEVGHLLHFGKVDATVHTGLKSRFGIDGFPTLKYTRDGKVWEEYDQGRTLADLVRFASRISGPAVTTVDTKAKLEKLAVANGVAFTLCDAVRPDPVACRGVR